MYCLVILKVSVNENLPTPTLFLNILLLANMIGGGKSTQFLAISTHHYVPSHPTQMEIFYIAFYISVEYMCSGQVSLKFQIHEDNEK